MKLDQSPDETISFYFLTPNTIDTRREWSGLIENELSKMGINITDNVMDHYEFILPRVYNVVTNTEYDHTPTYENGGYDTVFLSQSADLSYDPFKYYSTKNLTPEGLNLVRYNNSEIDSLIDSYRAEHNTNERSEIAMQIQAILYEDQPYIPIVNELSLWTHVTGLSLTENELLLMSTSDLGNGWANISHSDSNVRDIVYGHGFLTSLYHPFVSNPYLARTYQAPILASLYERSTENPHQFVPALADDMPIISDSGLNFTVDIRPDAEFYNPQTQTKSPVTANDVVNTYRMHMSPEIGSYQSGEILPYIQNEDQIIALDENTVKFTFNEPYFNALEVLSMGIMDDAVIGTPDSPATTDFNSAEYVVGAGPFYYSNIDINNKFVTISAVPNWYGGSISLDSITFEQVAENSATDRIQEPADSVNAMHIIDYSLELDRTVLENAYGVERSAINNLGVQYLGINMDHPILGSGVETPLGKQDPSRAKEAARYIRKAISHLIPRQIIIDDILNGLGTTTTSLWPEVSEGYDATLQPYQYDIDKAANYLQLAGYNTSGYPISNSETTDTGPSSSTPPELLVSLNIGFALIPLMTMTIIKLKKSIYK